MTKLKIALSSVIIKRIKIIAVSIGIGCLSTKDKYMQINRVVGAVKVNITLDKNKKSS